MSLALSTLVKDMAGLVWMVQSSTLGSTALDGFTTPSLSPGSVPTYNVVPYPSSVTIAPASIVHETVLAPQAKAYHSPPKYSSNSPPPISHTAVAVKPQSHGHHTSRRVSFRGGHYSHSQSGRGNHGMLGRR